MTTRLLRFGAAGLLLAVVAGCATGIAYRHGQSAARRGDWDAAVAFYREALSHDPGRIDVKIALQRAMGAAASEHIKRARDLEVQDQLPGAIAEYRLASDLDPTNTLAAGKANELDRKLRDRIEASRPPSRMDQLIAQNRLASTIPTLDPRIRVPMINFNGASVKGILDAIAAVVNPPINITYVSGIENLTGRSYSINVQDLSLEEALNQVLSNNNLAFKVVNSKTVLVFQDDIQNHTKYDDLYTQVFYLSNVEPADMIQIINQMTTAPGPPIRPQCSPSKATSAITCRATAQVMNVIERLKNANDKPKAEVVIDIEVLEVDRTRVKKLGLDLGQGAGQFAMGMTFSPEAAPPNTSGSFPPVTPPPFNANTVSQGITAGDMYLTVPTALVRLLESDSRTRTLAKPSIRGAEGAPMTMNLGDQIPTLNSTIPSVTTSVGTSAPVTNFTYKPVGVNISATPRVTFNDEIILDLTVQNNGIGQTLDVGGVAVQSFSDRTVHTVLRLRDGESNLMAGLLREQTSTKNTGLAGLARIPILRNIFGNLDQTIDQSDIIIIVTPHIVRSHELTADDLKPMFIGNQQNFGQTNTPSLIAADAPLPASGVPTGGVPVGGQAPTSPPAPAPAPAPARAPGVVPIVAADASPAPPAATTGIISVTAAPSEFQAGISTPHTVPISVLNMPEVGTITLTLTFNPAVLRAQNVTQGTFMNQGNTATTFLPKVDANAGQVQIVISRAGTGSGASGGGLLGSVQFLAMSPGSSQISLSGVAVGPNGQPVPVQFGSATVVVK